MRTIYSNLFPKTINTGDIIFSKKTVDFKLSENKAIKSSPDVLFFVISIFKRDGLNCVPAFMNSNKEASKEKTVHFKDPLNIAKIATPKSTIDRIIDVTA